MRRVIQFAATTLILIVLALFSYLYVVTSSMPRLAAVITLTVILIVPLTSLSYVFFRLAAREAQLKHLFKLPGILIAYLASKGKDVCPGPGEKTPDYLQRLRLEFDTIFETEMKGEYGRFQYLCGILIASAVTGLVLHYLATSSFGGFLIGSTNSLPTPFQFGLVGAFAWNLWLLLNSYETLDLPPSTFYWMTFRYVIAVTAGLFAYQVIKAEYANIFALVAAAMPYPMLLEFLRNKIAGLKEARAGQPPIWKIQGMPQTTIDRLATLGIYTTQEMAFSDPLMILFRTNYQPKIVIDWIDQSLLYSYLGESLGDDFKDLRLRGIRGSIELSKLKDDVPALSDVAKTLNISPNELRYFRDRLLDDYQLKLISTLWEEFKPQSSSMVIPQLAPSAASQVPIPEPKSGPQSFPDETPIQQSAVPGGTIVVSALAVEAVAGNGDPLKSSSEPDDKQSD